MQLDECLYLGGSDSVVDPGPVPKTSAHQLPLPFEPELALGFPLRILCLGIGGVGGVAVRLAVPGPGVEYLRADIGGVRGLIGDIGEMGVMGRDT